MTVPPPPPPPPASAPPACRPRPAGRPGMTPAAGAALVATRTREARLTGRLDLSDCDLISLPVSLFMILSEVDEGAPAPKPVTSVDLSGNRIRDIGPRIRDFDMLQSLDLRNNRLRQVPLEQIEVRLPLPDGDSPFQALRHIDLRGNPLLQAEPSQEDIARLRATVSDLEARGVVLLVDLPGQ
ncbi:hypothetical protein H696_03299 [Fonticula alba]|uniref:U2A'/phosphoprotein 32 family A C-terminal domain-containing protein n=1 Tax=Fonticula alba TaxID=691883 RepID=A0A058Z8G7_FONAL|nr:hypothetical protein H696_03299 [Fonticula alba]KCV69827.1 hypothetical protein H696_03299 [Fonticula alba]|eukprot:XP_009495433.1 hypothetical protein H696_03299 [Fonticula alba]